MLTHSDSFPALQPQALLHHNPMTGSFFWGRILNGKAYYSTRLGMKDLEVNSRILSWEGMCDSAQALAVANQEEPAAVPAWPLLLRVQGDAQAMY